MQQWQENEKGQKFCSDACAKTTWPKCSICSIPMNQWFTDDKGRKFCSDKCFNQILPTCSICHKTMKQWQENEKGQKFCSEKCFNQTLPTCEYCGKRIKEWYTYDDGYKYCSDECHNQSTSKVDLKAKQKTGSNSIENIADMFKNVSTVSDDHDQKIELMKKWNYIMYGYISDKNLQKEFKIKNISDVNCISDLKNKIDNTAFIKKYSAYKEIDRSMSVANKKLVLINLALQVL